jgi:hypothetical protein
VYQYALGSVAWAPGAGAPACRRRLARDRALQRRYM